LLSDPVHHLVVVVGNIVFGNFIGRRVPERKPISAAFWASVSSRGAVDLNDILAQRRHADVWERCHRGEATSVDVYDAYMDAYVPNSTAARVAQARKDEDFPREIDDTHMLRTIAAWRLRKQLTGPGE
jgi:hypothetical protein